MFVRFVQAAERGLRFVAFRALAEYVALWLLLAARLPEASTLKRPWYALLLALLPWLLLRWFDLRKLANLAVRAAITRRIESFVVGLVVNGLILRFFFGAQAGFFLYLVASSAAVTMGAEFFINDGLRVTVAAWYRRHLGSVWPQAGIAFAVTLAVWLWDRMALADDLPAPVYFWVMGAVTSVVWWARGSYRWWHSLFACCLAVGPIIWALAPTPAGDPPQRLVLLFLLTFLFSVTHAFFVRRQNAEEILVVWLLGLAGLWLSKPMLTAQANGGGDAHWYTMVMADALAQWRVGIFPPFVGQSIYAFSGSSFPGCFASYYQTLGIILDTLSGRTLNVYAIQHATVVLSLLGGIYAVYFVLRAFAPERRGAAALVAILFGASPAWLGPVYSMDMYMTTMTLPWLPLVAFGCLRTFVRLDWRSGMWLTVPLSVAWYGHPPVALWATVAAGVTQLVRLISHRRPWRVELGWLGRTAALFIVLTCLPFATALSAESATDNFRQAYVLKTMTEHWSAAWKAVSTSASLLSDQHLGWSLAVVAIVGGMFAVRKKQRSLRALVLPAACLLFLLIPIPGIQDLLWRALPSTLKIITNNWPTQRIYPVMTSFIAVGCGVAVLRQMRASLPATRAIHVMLCLGAIWSFSEAFKFYRRGYATTLDRESSERRVMPENVVLTRYAYEMFSRRPEYISHGVMDPLMKQRLLDLDSLSEIASNPSAAAAGLTGQTFSMRARRINESEYELTPNLCLMPGRRYLLEFKFEPQPYDGHIFIRGERLDRSYRLPSDGGPRAFGSGPTQGKYITLWTEGNALEIVRWTYRPTGSQSLPEFFARVKMVPIEEASLPVQVHTLLPYRATVQAAQVSWLETPRMFLPGYRTSVNGKPAEMRQSPQGLLLIKVSAGKNEVELTYPGPAAVRAAFWIACLSWVTLILFLAWKLRTSIGLPAAKPASNFGKSSATVGNIAGS